MCMMLNDVPHAYCVVMLSGFAARWLGACQRSTRPLPKHRNFGHLTPVHGADLHSQRVYPSHT